MVANSVAEPDRAVRVAALAGVVGPATFVGAWIAGAVATTAPYSSIDDAISRLAAVGADTRWLMTTGMVTFGVALPVYGWALRSTVRAPAWVTATATGLATLGVAATPLDRSNTVDTLHALFAGIGYVTLAATPLLAARPLMTAGHGRLARLGVLTGFTSTVALLLTTTELPSGLCQRIGLTAGDVWIVASALAMASGRLRPGTTRRRTSSARLISPTGRR